MVDPALPPAGTPALPPQALRDRVLTALWVGLAAALALALLYLLAPMLTPFALAAVLAYLLAPVVARLCRLGCPPALASALVVVLFLGATLGLLLVLVPVLEREGQALYRQLPALVTHFNDQVAPLLSQWLGLQVHLDPAALQALALQQVGQQDSMTALLSRFGSGSLALLQAAGTALLVPVVLFYLLLDGRAIADRLDRLVPRRWHAHVRDMLGEIDAVLAQFLRGQLTVMLLLSAYYCVALSLAGFESAVPIGLLTGLLIFIPYVGYGLGLLLAAVVALLQFAPWQAGVSLAVVYGIGQILEGFVLTPRLVGKRVGLHPLAVIFALLAFAQVFGFFGVLVALPASAVLLVALRHVRSAYLASAFYRRP